MSIGTIEELKTKKCQPCEGGVPREEAERLLQDLPGWELSQDGKRIRREWTAKHFMAAMDFFNRVPNWPKMKATTPIFTWSAIEVSRSNCGPTRLAAYPRTISLQRARSTNCQSS